MARRHSPGSADTAKDRPPLSELFHSHEAMAESLEALLEFLARRTRAQAERPRPVSLLGFALQHLRVELSDIVQTIEVEARFAEDSALVLLPSRPEESASDRQARLLAVVDRLLPSVKETHLRAAGQFYCFLDPVARKRLVEAYRQRTAEEP